MRWRLGQLSYDWERVKRAERESRRDGELERGERKKPLRAFWVKKSSRLASGWSMLSISPRIDKFFLVVFFSTVKRQLQALAFLSSVDIRNRDRK